MMKKIYRPLLKGTNWALAGILALLGFSSCESTEEYGSPHAEYTVKGSVTDEKGNALEGIGIYKSIEFQYRKPDTVYTNKKGEFEITDLAKEIKLIAEDVDGPKNGLFKKDSVEVTFSNEDFYEKGKGWYKGAAKKEIDPIVLKEVEEEKTDE